MHVLSLQSYTPSVDSKVRGRAASPEDTRRRRSMTLSALIVFVLSSTATVNPAAATRSLGVHLSHRRQLDETTPPVPPAGGEGSPSLSPTASHVDPSPPAAATQSVTREETAAAAAASQREAEERASSPPYPPGVGPGVGVMPPPGQQTVDPSPDAEALATPDVEAAVAMTAAEAASRAPETTDQRARREAQERDLEKAALQRLLDKHVVTREQYDAGVALVDQMGAGLVGPNPTEEHGDGGDAESVARGSPPVSPPPPALTPVPERTMYYLPRGLTSNCEFTMDKARWFAERLRVQTLMLPDCFMQMDGDRFDHLFYIDEYFVGKSMGRCSAGGAEFDVKRWHTDGDNVTGAVCVAASSDNPCLWDAVDEFRSSGSHSSPRFGDGKGGSAGQWDAIYDSWKDVPAEYSGKIYVANTFDACIPKDGVNGKEAGGECLPWFGACEKQPVFRDNLRDIAKDIVFHQMNLKNYACLHWRQGDFVGTKNANFVDNATHAGHMTANFLRQTKRQSTPPVNDLVITTNDDTPIDRISELKTTLRERGINSYMLSDYTGHVDGFTRMYLGKLACAMADNYIGVEGSSFSESILALRMSCSAESGIPCKNDTPLIAKTGPNSYESRDALFHREDPVDASGANTCPYVHCHLGPGR